MEFFSGLLFLSFSSFVIALSGALVPGPLFTIAVSESAKRGFIAGPLLILGHALLELLTVALLLAGLSPFLSSEAFKFWIGLIGGGVLIFMGASLLRDSKTARLTMDAGTDAKGKNPVALGILGSISNPYWAIWWATIGAGYLVSSLRFGIAGVAAFFAGHILADLSWYSAISFAVSRGRRLMGDRGYRALIFLCGAFLVLFGAWFIRGI